MQSRGTYCAVQHTLAVRLLDIIIIITVAQPSPSTFSGPESAGTGEYTCPSARLYTFNAAPVVALMKPNREKKNNNNNSERAYLVIIGLSRSLFLLLLVF